MSRKYTCKCVDYFIDKNNNKYVRQRQRKNGDLIELRCKNKVYKNTNFCKKHQDCPKFLKNFLNNEEEEYNPGKWSNPYIEGSHNCYAYFLDTIFEDLRKKCTDLCYKNSNECPKKVKQCRKLIPQPGDYHLIKNEGSLKNKNYRYTCKEVENKILNDNPSIIKTELIKKCPKNYYKGSMVVDPGNTFHFYRQNKKGTWSHKPGTLPVSNLDADRNIIYTPHTANRNYSKPNDSDPINYTNFCGYYCIPKNKKRRAK